MSTFIDRARSAASGLPLGTLRSSTDDRRDAREGETRSYAHPLTVTERARLIRRRGVGPITGIPRGLASDPRIRARLRSKALPVGVAAIVLGAALISVPGAPDASGSAGSLTGRGSQPRLAVAGAALYRGGPSGAGHDLGWDGSLALPPGVSAPVPDGPQGGGAPDDAAAAVNGSTLLPQDELAAERPGTPKGAYLADGTLLKPIAVDTSVPDSKGMLKTYRVRAGDTLTGIANRFGVSMMTIWWANNLEAKDALVVGQKLLIPPTNGLVVTVKEGDTLSSIASRAGASAADIIEYNGLEGDRVVIGQTLVVPGARGAPIATPKPTPAPRAATTRPGSSGSSRQQATSARPPTRYNGGSFKWPVAGGYLSQRYHYGHYGIDIAADRGTPVLAAAPGVITFAGWRSNGGGYQVWISHGSSLYTTYNHMSSVSVHAGQRVSKGQRVGRVGATGWATGPHLHFEVWRGGIWNGGHRVNPYGYL